MAITAVGQARSLTEVEEIFGEAPERLQGQRPNYAVDRPLGAISGFTNYDLTQMKVMAVWRAALIEVFQRDGFTPFEPRPVEYACNLEKAGGIGKQIYGVSRLDGGLTLMGIPFDRTVPMAIMIAQHHHEIAFPLNRYDIGWAFRGEHATKGRYRAFIQADVDIVDRKLTVRSDAQCIATGLRALLKLGVPECTVFINHVDIAKSFLNDAGISPEYHKEALRVIDKLKPDNEAAVVEEFCEKVPGMDPEKAKSLLDKMNYRGPISGFTFRHEPTPEAAAAYKHLCELERIVGLMGVPTEKIKFAANLARGLDYYTGVVFETFIHGRERYGSIASGGRYDNLIGDFNEHINLQGVGYSIGVTRLFDIMQLENLVDLSQQTTAQVFVGYREDSCLDTALAVASRLRASGVNVELHSSNQRVGAQLALVDRKGIPCAALVMNPHEIIVKDMKQKKESAAMTLQTAFATVEEAADHIVGKLSAS